MLREMSCRTSAAKLLGVAPNASTRHVQAAFRKKALETHPDRGGCANQFLAVRDSACVSGVTRLRSTRRCRGDRRWSQQDISGVTDGEKLICAASPVRMRFERFLAERRLYVASAGVRRNA